MIRAIIVDDEKPSREVIMNYLRDYCSDVDVIATASSVKSAFKTITKYNPDVVFLDIELSDGSGFDLLKMFDNINYRVIFITAYSEYAIKAFRVNAADYLLKPVKIDELQSAVEKIKNLKNNSLNSANLFKLIKNIEGSLHFRTTIVIPHLKGFEVLKINDIIMCKADGYCTNFFMKGKKKVVSSRNLKQYETLLTGHNFIRVHHSYLINLNHVTGYNRQGEITLAEDIRASLGDNFKSIFLERFSRK